MSRDIAFFELLNILPPTDHDGSDEGECTICAAGKICRQEAEFIVELIEDGLIAMGERVHCLDILLWLLDQDSPADVSIAEGPKEFLEWYCSPTSEEEDDE